MPSDERIELARCAPATTSELNNLLQIISGTASLIEDLWTGDDDSGKYFTMLRESIERAEKITAQLAQQSGGTKETLLLNSASASAVTPAQSKPSSRPQVRNKPSILLIEDEAMAAMLMKRTLTNAGFETVTARSGFEGLDFFRRRPRDFDLVIVDLTMPFMNGEETFARIRDISAGIPVIITTGFIEQKQLDRMLSTGLSGFLRKPHGPGELLSCVQSVLESSNLLRRCSDTSGSRVGR
jgi:CheY-like chemotaxis protein